MERTKRKSSVYNDCVPYGGRVPNFKEKEGMKLKKEQFDVTGMTYVNFFRSHPIRKTACLTEKKTSG